MPAPVSNNGLLDAQNNSSMKMQMFERERRMKEEIADRDSQIESLVESIKELQGMVTDLIEKNTALQESLNDSKKESKSLTSKK